MDACPRCGHENPANARFCNTCGTLLAGEPAPARKERRIVTVLFADLVGFTARAERLDPEDVQAILNVYYGRLRAEMEAFGGTVEKFIGDAVVAVFGAPVAHGDDPERAVRAALAIREAVTELNEADPELDLQLRLAVNTGEAIVSLGARTDLGEGLVAGDVVNTAARIQSAAPAGSILVGEETYRATRSLFAWREAEPLEVKGKSEPVRVWTTVASVSDPGERSAHAVPMLGRANELHVLRRIFETVVADRRPHLVTVVGDAGIGKTRLGAEFTELLERNGACVLRGRSLPYGDSTPYGPFTQQVKQLAGIFASDDLASANEKLRAAIRAVVVPEAADEVAEHLAILVGLTVEGEVADRQILFFSARRVAEALATGRPTVLLFEDLHWADEGTLDLVELLASRVRDVPLLLIAHARPALLQVRPGWGGGLPVYTSLSLETLGAEHARELAVRLLEAAGAPAGDAELIAGKAEGNPLFIEEFAAAIAERSAPVAHELPTTIRELVSARLDALSPSERPVLLDAAVVGKVFWRGALERMSGNGSKLAHALDSLEGRDLIRRESFSWIDRDEQFSFKHAIIRDVAYATLPRATRRERHAVVARFLEEETAGAAATATALARHWSEAGDEQRALRYLVLAADQAWRGWAKDEAAVLYGQALSLVPESDDALRRDLVRKQALATAAIMHITDARRLARDRPSSAGSPQG